jgi:AcrR family transcriptional regulator
MNHLPARFRTPDAPDRPLTRRAQGKLETRDKVLEAAKRLFIRHGYQAATIRDIATEAGMSTGAVFANFSDKNDLFHAVLGADLDAHLAMMQGAIGHAGPIDAALRELFAIGYKMQLNQLPLLRAATGLSWTSGLEGEFGDRPQSRKVTDVVAEMLSRAADRGELAPQSDYRIIASMVWDLYIANYRRALFDDWGLDELKARFARQIAIILDGLRPAQA